MSVIDKKKRRNVERKQKEKTQRCVVAYTKGLFDERSVRKNEAGGLRRELMNKTTGLIIVLRY